MAHHIANSKYLFIDNKIIKLSDYRIHLHINMYTNKEAVLQSLKDQEEKWIKLINKKYNPKTTWELRIFSDYKIDINNIQIVTIERERAKEFYTKKAKAIWLVSGNNKRIKAENKIRQSGTEKTLRALYSRHKIKVKSIKEEHPWYYLTVGIESNAT